MCNKTAVFEKIFFNAGFSAFFHRNPFEKLYKKTPRCYNI
jgi:hypothetical protein